VARGAVLVVGLMHQKFASKKPHHINAPMLMQMFLFCASNGGFRHTLREPQLVGRTGGIFPSGPPTNIQTNSPSVLPIRPKQAQCSGVDGE
jgi:hypothetical protein